MRSLGVHAASCSFANGFCWQQALSVYHMLSHHTLNQHMLSEAKIITYWLFTWATPNQHLHVGKPVQAVFSCLLWSKIAAAQSWHATSTYQSTCVYLKQVVFWCARFQFHGLLMLQELEQFWALGSFAIQNSSGQRWSSFSMWMEAFLEVPFCQAPRCHCIDNITRQHCYTRSHQPRQITS